MNGLFALPVASILVLAAASAAPAAIVYVDATTSNTTNADGTAFTPTADAARSGADNLWTVRENSGLTSTGTLGQIYESNGTNTSGAAGAEDSPALKTTITGLTPGATYRIYTFFYSQQSSPTTEWSIKSGLSLAALVGYTGEQNNVTPPAGSTLPTTTDVTLATADGATDHLPAGYVVVGSGAPTRLYQALVGTVVADGTGTLAVYQDDFANGSTPYRTRYDGVGYQVVAAVPEPASLGMLAAAGGLVAAGRRRGRRHA